MSQVNEQRHETIDLINKYVDAIFAYGSFKSEENYTYLVDIKQEYKNFLEAGKK